ncbi:Uncharacterised protein [uncultured archaeon]|nr:Uncharacterised protein [uncultured archaeon]
MKRSKGMQLAIMLAAMLLLSMALVPGAMAQLADKKGTVIINKLADKNDTVIINKDIKDIDKKYANGNGQLLTQSPSGSGVSTLGTKQWSAYTDIYNYGIFSDYPRLNTYSKSRDSGSPWDIDKIGVRGRVWRDDNLIFDQTVTNYNTADASIYWESGCTLCAGSYLARGNHVFETQGYNSWYPVTNDTLNV